MTTVRPGANFTVIQALRGFAAMWVVLFHLSEGGHVAALKRALPGWCEHAVFDAGHLGVPIFFALSGFVIAHSLAGKEATPAFFGRFILRRSLRLDPAYWCAIAFAIALAFLSAKVTGAAWPGIGLRTVLLHILYLQGIFGERPINDAFWTLAYEVQFYLFFVGALVARHALARRSRPAAVGVDVFLLAVAILAALGQLDFVPKGVFLPLWGCFYVGVMAYRAGRSNIAIVGLGVLSIALASYNSFTQTSAVTAVGLFFALRSGWILSGLNWRWLQFLGTISYSLYLLHSPVTGAVGFVTRRALGDTVFASVAALVLATAASVVAAWILWAIVERPTHRLAKTLFAERRGSRSTTEPVAAR
ncbi:acyltransferase family protein [Sphingomonas sp. Tas61C01]|uniref:acyltransferase family protein n=1 Tax=Sphingomonas sp. Tas61C01 TaxID=3458297 RepID=UPI00403EEFA5